MKKRILKDTDSVNAPSNLATKRCHSSKESGGSYGTCKKIVNSEDRTYSDEEVKLISEWLWQLAELSIENYLQTKKSSEGSITV